MGYKRCRDLERFATMYLTTKLANLHLIRRSGARIGARRAPSWDGTIEHSSFENALKRHRKLFGGVSTDTV